VAVGRPGAGGLSPAGAPPTPAAAGDLAAPVAPVPRWRRYRGDALVLLGYLLAAGYVTSGWWRHPGRVDPVENGADPAFFEWAFGHAVRIFTAGENPLSTPGLNAPLGVNLMANTGMLGVSVPLVPVTVLAGPAVSLVLAVTLGLAGTAGSWYLVLRRYLPGSRAAAVAGGAFCGFAPGMVNHANAHQAQPAMDALLRWTYER